MGTPLCCRIFLILLLLLQYPIENRTVSTDRPIHDAIRAHELALLMT